MSIVLQTEVIQQQIQQTVGNLGPFVEAAARNGTAVHEVEKGLWQELLRLGQQCLSRFFALVGEGDLGETVRSDDGQQWQRLDERHCRRYVSIFGTFDLQRVVYGSREGQKLAFVPLDNRLQLPASVYSYLLQDWSQGLCVESAFGQVAATLARMFGLKLSSDALERINTQMAQRVADYRYDRPKPVAETEGEVVVASGDGKGIVMRRPADDPAPAAHRTKGEKASHKQMAMVGSVYTVDRHVRTPEEVVAALFRDPREDGDEPPARPKPQQKRVMASLSRSDANGVQAGVDIVHEWMVNELIERNRQDQAWRRPMVSLYDGQELLWEARQRYLPSCSVNILDFLHVTPRLWQAAHVFHPEGSDAAEAFVRERCLRVLQSRVTGVIRGLREMATKHGLSGSKKKTITQVCAYLEKNRSRMRYDEYLAAGYPIASGVIEGACRHLVKDRMERAGMHWTPKGAQAMLDVRSVQVDGDWDGYQTYRIERETRELYPHRYLVEGTQYTLACYTRNA
jgi:hypothetical protein